MADELVDAGGKTKGFLKHKIGPLEVWQWGAATLGVLFAYMAYKRSRSGGSAAGAGAPASVPATATNLPGSGGNPTDLGTTISGQLTNLTGQVGALQQTVAGLGTTPAGAAAVQTSNGISSDVQNLYNQIGVSSPDAAGAAYWQTQINSGVTGSNLLNEFVGATPSATTGFVTQEYQTQLHRAPDTAGLAFWEGQVQTLGATQEQRNFTAAVQGGAH